MAIRNKPIYQALALIFLGAALIVWSGCGSDDNPIVTEDTLDDDSTPTIDDPTPVVLTGSLKGQVETIEGVPINIQVLQNGKVIASTQTNADGNYQIDSVEPGTYTVQITAKGYRAADLTVQVIADQVKPLDKVALEALEIPVSHIRGRLSDQATKKPLDRVRVQLIDDAGNIREALTKATGVFEFENVPANQPFTVLIDHDGYEQQEIKIDPVPAAEAAKITNELVPVQQGEQPPVGEGLAIGAKAPDFRLPDGDGKIHALADYAAEKKIVLVFYRGIW